MTNLEATSSPDIDLDFDILDSELDFTDLLLNRLRTTQYNIGLSDVQHLTQIIDVYGSGYGEKGEVGLLAITLAREAMFGNDIMAECTPTG